MIRKGILFLLFVFWSWGLVHGTLYLSPEADLPYIQIRNPEMPGQVFRWRVPEYVDNSTAWIPHDISWTRKDTATWLIEWQASKEDHEKIRRDFKGEVVMGVDYVDLFMTVWNPTDKGWPVPDYWIISLVCGPADQFHDVNGERTYIRRDGKFVLIRDALDEHFTPQMMGTFNIGLEPSHARWDYRTDAPFIARVSRDGKWIVAAVGGADSNGPGFNLGPNTSCLNTNHTWKQLGPGQEDSAQFRVYILKGGVEDAWKRYVRDFDLPAGMIQGKSVQAETKPAQSEGTEASEEGENLKIDGLEISTARRMGNEKLASVWEPATALTTFGRIVSKRPAECSKDALECWIADTAARDGTPKSYREIQSERKAFAVKQGFFVREKAGNLWVANGQVGLKFMKQGNGYGLVSFYDLAHHIEMIHERPANGSFFRIQVLRYRPDGTTGVLTFTQDGGTGPDTSFITEADARQASESDYTMRIGGGKLVLDFMFTGVSVPDTPGELNVSVEVVLDADESLVRWKSGVSGTLPQAGISQVRCPVLSGFGYSGENDFIYGWGSQRGIFKRGDQGVSQGAYPSSQWSIQHFSISFGPEVSFYTACEDPDSYVKSFKWHPGSELYLSAYVPNTGVMGQAEYVQPYYAATGPISGDWFDSAKRYRAWAVENAPWASKKLIDRTDVVHRMLKVGYWARCSYFNDNGNDGDESWAFDQQMMRVAPAQTVDWYKRELDIPWERLGAIHYNWQEQIWDTRLPWWTPFDAKIAEEMRRETELGMSIVAYTNPCWYDPKLPSWNSEIEKAITRNIDGSMYFEQYNAKMYEINRGTELFRDVLKKLAILLQGMGSNGIYYDQYAGVIRGGDYDPNKGLPNLGRGGNWLPKAKQSAIRETRNSMGEDYGFVSEFLVETNMHLFDVQSVTIHSDPIEGPFIPAIYSGYMVQYGAGLHYQTRPAASMIALGHNFLWGTSFGWTQFCTELKRNYSRNLLRQLVQLRIQLDDFLVYGEMLRPPKFASDVPVMNVDYWNVYGQERLVPGYDTYEAALWGDGDGRRVLLLMNYDQRRHEPSFNLSELSIASLADVRLLEPSGGAVMRIEDGLLKVDMAGRSGAALILMND